MKNLALKVSAALATALLMCSHSAQADEVSAEQILSNGGRVDGGTVQHTDPTAYNYVPLNVEDPFKEDRSAKGYAFVPGFTYNGNTIPAGQIFHAIDGNGTWIDFERATYTAAGNICNYRFDYQNRDMNGNISWTLSNGDHGGCQFGMVGDQGVRNINVKKGMMCARLYVSGSFKGEQCHHIH